jgi:TRAP-type mannitol/chloroaromatic compound transport system permease small subunit
MKYLIAALIVVAYAILMVQGIKIIIHLLTNIIRVRIRDDYELIYTVIIWIRIWF